MARTKSEPKPKPERLTVKIRPGFHTKGNPAVLAERLRVLALEKKTKRLREGGVSTRRLMEDSKNEDSPFHEQFLWDDDSKAANEYRKILAGKILQSFSFLWVDDKGTQHESNPAYLCISEPETGERLYVPAPSIRDETDIWKEAVDATASSISFLQNRLLNLKRLPPEIMKAFSELTAWLEAEAAKTRTGRRKRKTG